MATNMRLLWHLTNFHKTSGCEIPTPSENISCISPHSPPFDLCSTSTAHPPLAHGENGYGKLVRPPKEKIVPA